MSEPTLADLLGQMTRRDCERLADALAADWVRSNRGIAMSCTGATLTSIVRRIEYGEEVAMTGKGSPWDMTSK